MYSNWSKWLCVCMNKDVLQQQHLRDLKLVHHFIIHMSRYDLFMSVCYPSEPKAKYVTLVGRLDLSYGIPFCQGIRYSTLCYNTARLSYIHAASHHFILYRQPLYLHWYLMFFRFHQRLSLLFHPLHVSQTTCINAPILSIPLHRPRAF